MKFEYYVLNYDFNRKKVINFNIFQNWVVNNRVEKEIRKYLRAPSKYKYIKQYKNEYLDREEIAIYGFEALCAEINSIIKWQEWGRREYEISVGDAFEEDLSKYKKIDCYQQVKPNIEMVTRELIWQYKHRDKDSESEV